MSKIKFAKPGTPGTLVPAPAEPSVAPVVPPVTPVSETTVVPPGAALPAQALIPCPVLPVATATPASPFNDDDDDFNPGDLVLPRWVIVQKVGDLSNVFKPGSLVLDGALVVRDAPVDMVIGPSVRLVVLGLQKTYFAEKVEGGARGEMFKSENEVVANGGTLDWNEWKRQEGKVPLFQRVSTGLLLIEQPETLDPNSFPHSVAGKNYALAIYTMKGVAYTNAARHFKSAKKLNPVFRDPVSRELSYRGAFWTFSAKLEKYGSNYAYRPVVKLAESTTPDFRAQVQSLLGF
jgi:hypothetical protein